MIKKVFGDDSMSEAQIKLWYSCFKNGRESVESYRRSGRLTYLNPVLFDKHENVMFSALGFLEVHQHTEPVFFATVVQNLSVLGSDELRILTFHYEFKISNLFPLKMFCKYLVSSLNLSQFTYFVNKRETHLNS
jgi:hypothetical protein